MLNNGVATSPLDLPKIRQEGFATWLRKKVINSRDEGDYYIRMVGIMPSKEAYFYEGCEVNGYRFHAQKYGQTMSSKSSGVCIKGEWDANNTPIDYYGILQEIIELQYDAHTVLLFKCDWFDIINGVKVDRKHGIVEVKHTSRLRNYEPFVLAAQATQVCYLPYPSQKAERRQWWVAMKTSPKSRFRSEGDDTNIEFYQEERPDNPIEPTIGEDIDWDGMVIREDEFEIVTDTTNLPPSTSTSNEPPSLARDENNVEEGENEDDIAQDDDMEQYDEEDGLQSDDPDEEY